MPGTPSPIHEARERHPLPKIVLASAHPPRPLRILAGELQAGARAGTPKQKVFSLLIIYSQFRKLQDPIGKTQTRSRSRRAPAGGFEIPIYKKVWKSSTSRSRFEKGMDFKIPACLIRALRAPDIGSISDQEPRAPPLQFRILQDPDVKRGVNSKSRARSGSGASSSIQDISRSRRKT